MNKEFSEQCEKSLQFRFLGEFIQGDLELLKGVMNDQTKEESENKDLFKDKLFTIVIGKRISTDVEDILKCFNSIHSIVCHEDHFKYSPDLDVGKLELIEDLNITLDDEGARTYRSFPECISFMKSLKEIYIDSYKEEFDALDGLNFQKLEAVKYKLGKPALPLKIEIPGTEVVENAPDSLKSVTFHYRAKQCTLVDEQILKNLYLKGLPKAIYKVSTYQFYLVFNYVLDDD